MEEGQSVDVALREYFNNEAQIQIICYLVGNKEISLPDILRYNIVPFRGDNKKKN